MRKLRDIAAAACLAILLLANGWRFRRWELKRRCILLAKTAGLTLDEARMIGPTFLPDREYSEFLVSVRERIPPTASVAVSIPPGSRPVVYNAHYLLAPRAVLPLDRVREADWVALFRVDSSDRAAIPVAHGTLWRTR